MKRILFLLAVLILAIPQLSAADTLPPVSAGDQPLVFTNKSGQAVDGIYFTPCGGGGRSENLLGGSPLEDGETRALDIGRGGMIRRCDMELALADGRRIFWHRLQLGRIFEMALDEKGRAVCQTVNLRS